MHARPHQSTCLQVCMSAHFFTCKQICIYACIHARSPHAHTHAHACTSLPRMQEGNCACTHEHMQTYLQPCPDPHHTHKHKTAPHHRGIPGRNGHFWLLVLITGPGAGASGVPVRRGATGGHFLFFLALLVSSVTHRDGAGTSFSCYQCLFILLVPPTQV